jgi:hypothetical protein
MKTRLATLISVGGVLIAGTAAAMVNTQIFDSEPTVAGESAALLAPDPTTVDLVVSSSDDSTTTSTTSADAASGSLTEFAVGDSGFVSVDPAPGWSVDKQEEYDSGDHVEVSLRSGSTVIEFEADLVDGRIVPELAATTFSATTSATVDDESDDDRYEDDDHEQDDDHHEDDDDD